MRMHKLVGYSIAFLITMVAIILVLFLVGPIQSGLITFLAFILFLILCKLFTGSTPLG